MVKKAISDITSASDSQQDTITNQSDSTISTWTELCITLRNNIEAAEKDIIKNVISQSKQAEHSSIEKITLHGSNLVEKMIISHSA